MAKDNFIISYVHPYDISLYELSTKLENWEITSIQLVKDTIKKIKGSKKNKTLEWLIPPLQKIISKLFLRNFDMLSLISFVELTFANIVISKNSSENLAKHLFKFKEIENILFTIDKKYREHFYHQFRVFLIGLQVYLNLPTGISEEDLLCWAFISYFHDFGYGIQKIEGFSERYNEFYKVIGLSRTIFDFTESKDLYRNIITTNFRKMFPDSTIPGELTLKNSLDDNTHGYISGLYFLAECANDPQIRSNMQLWKVAEQAALAMAFHTLSFPLENINEISIDKNPKLFPAFLLTFVDIIEFIDRPKFVKGNYVRDIKMNLIFNISSNSTGVAHISVECHYKSQYTDLKPIAQKIWDAMSSFASDQLSLEIKLVSELAKGARKKIILYFLLKEQQEFQSWRSKCGIIGIPSFEDYKEFVYTYSNPYRIQSWKDRDFAFVPTRLSAQIKQFV